MTNFIRLTAIIILSVIFAHTTMGLRMSEMPDIMQTKVTEPLERIIHLKLPLLQPKWHWTFRSKKDFLAGSLVLHIERNGETEDIVIFKDGILSPDWKPMSIPSGSKVGEIYFGFISTKKYFTAPEDRLKLELSVTKDLDGIGPRATGVLSAGTYSAAGRYSGLVDEDVAHDKVKDFPLDKIVKSKWSIEFVAFLENWESQWPLQITSDDGWMPKAIVGSQRADDALTQIEKDANAFIALTNSGKALTEDELKDMIEKQTQNLLLLSSHIRAKGLTETQRLRYDKVMALYEQLEGASYDSKDGKYIFRDQTNPTSEIK